MDSPIAAKSILAQLNGAFPIDKAVIEGEIHFETQ
jgi:hypothetical protein